MNVTLDMRSGNTKLGKDTGVRIGNDKMWRECFTVGVLEQSQEEYVT